MKACNVLQRYLHERARCRDLTSLWVVLMACADMDTARAVWDAYTGTFPTAGH